MSGSKYIVRQPIKDLSGKIIGHEILYHGENHAYSGLDGTGGSSEFAAADTIYTFLSQNTDKVLKGSLNFMTFTTTLLMKQTPKLFRPRDLVIQVDDSVIIHPLAMRFVERFSKEGYQIAANDFQFSPRFFSLLDRFDYIKVNLKTASEASIRNIVEMAHSMNKQCIATGIDDEDSYQKAFILGMDAMEGHWVAERLFTTVHSSNYLRSNFFRLMVAITEDSPNMEKIETIIATDAMLTYSLLKIVNSGYFALRNRATDIHQAIIVMGLVQLQQWIYLLGVGDTENGSLSHSQEEFLKLSFMRGSFCKKLMKLSKNMPITSGEAYLMGMFSTLNYLIAAPLKQILDELSVVQEVKDALLYRKGRCGILYELVLAYERADWAAIGRLADAIDIPVNLLTSTYFKCLDEVNTTWLLLMEHNNSTSIGG